MITEGRISFVFARGVAAVKYDEWPPYLEWRAGARHRKGVDIVAYDRRVTWFVEVKDFRVQPKAPRAANSSALARTVGAKVRGTLAGLTAIAGQGDGFASEALRSSRRCRVVLHLEPPVRGSRLFPSLTQVANIHKNLRLEVREIDPTPLILRKSNTATAGVPWRIG